MSIRYINKVYFAKIYLQAAYLYLQRTKLVRAIYNRVRKKTRIASLLYSAKCLVQKIGATLSTKTKSIHDLVAAFSRALGSLVLIGS